MRHENMNDFESIKHLLRCPDCQSSILNMVDSSSNNIVCGNCASHYPVSSGRPVLLRADNDVFDQDSYLNAKQPVQNNISQRLKKIIPKSSVNLSSKSALLKVSELLSDVPFATVLVVGGGCQREWLDVRLGASDAIQIVYSDIDVGADVDVFCDGHDLPFLDAAFDAVVTTAVLEHVLYPERVASEIVRVLKTGGLLYSELPFMQQVHEGAYDFTRYTMSGHRRLFNGVSEIESGIVAGPGTALVWAIESFILAFITQSQVRMLSKVTIRFLFSWIKYFDLLLKDKPAALDGASCTYLLGTKNNGCVSDAEIIMKYTGAQKLRHI